LKQERRRALLVQILALTVVPFTLLLLALVFGAQTLHLTALRQLIGERDERAARAAANAMDDQLRDLVTAVNSVAFQASAIGDSTHALTDAGYLFPEFDGGLAQFTANGSLAQTTRRSTFWDEELVQAELVKLRESNELLGLSRFLTVIADPTTGEKTLLVAGMMEDGSVAAGAVTLEKLAQQALGDVFSLTEQASVLIVDENYELLYWIGPTYWSEDELSNHPAVAQALGGQRGSTYHNQGEQEHIIAYSPIPGVNWALVIEEPWQSVADPVLEATELVPLALVPALIIALVAILFGFRQIVQPLQSLEQRTSKLAQGHYEAIEEPVGGISEIQNLQSELVQMARRVNRAQRSLRDYLGTVTVEHEEERSRLARDLHDDTIQSLVALTRKAQLIKISLDGQPEADQLGEMEEMTTQIIDDLRRIAGDLRPIYLEELGLPPALRMLAKDAGSALNIPIAFTVTGSDQRLSPDIELALYRIAQEALSNIVHHAQASQATVRLDLALEVFTLTVTDDGRGFDVPESPAEMAAEGSYGLLGLYERAELIGARLMVQSAPNQGTTVTVTMPA
jgi:signal transduction histidine kinase